MLVEGEPDEAFPDLIRFNENGEPVEPLAADVRGASKSEMRKKLNAELLRLAAPLLHCGYDDLKQRHRERRIRRAMAAMAAVMALMGGFAGYYAYTAARIAANFREKQINQSKYLADTAISQLKAGDRMTAIRVALDALPDDDNDRPYVAKAEYALNETLYSYHVGGELVADRALVHSQPVSDFDMSLSGDYALTVDQGETVTVFDTKSGEKKAEIKAGIKDNSEVLDVQDAGFLGEDAFIIVYEDKVEGYDINGEIKFSFGDGGDYFRSFKYHADTNRLIVAAQKELFLLNPTDGELIGSVAPITDDSSFGHEMCFSEDGKLFAISIFKSSHNESNTGSVYVLEPDIIEGRFYNADKVYIEQTLFVDNEHLVVASDGYNENGILLGDGSIELIDLGSGAPLWSTGYEYEVYVMAGSSMDMYSRDYTDGAGEEHHSIIFSQNNSLEAIDTQTGEKKCSLKKSSSVTGLFVIKDSPLVYTLERSGAFTVQDVENGREYTDNAVDTGFTIVEAKNARGTIGIQGYQSPDLVLMRYVEGEGMELLGEYDDDVASAAYNADGSLAAVQIGYGETAAFKIFDTGDFSVKGEFTPNDYIDKWAFDDDGILYVFADDKLYRYDASKDETTVAQGSSDDAYYSSYVIDLKARKAIAYRTGFMLIDLDSMETVLELTSEAGIRLAATGGENGDKLLTVTKDAEISVIDISDANSPQETVISDEKLKCFLGTGIENSIDISNDGSKAVFNCQDGTARVYDLANGMISDEIPFDGRYRALLRFSNDGKYLMMQGDDYYFRVYDLDGHRMFAFSDEQLYEIKDVIYESGKIKLVSSSFLYILNEDTYELTAAIDGGRAASMGKGQVLVARYQKLYKFPYMGLDELMDIAGDELNGYELSEEKRLQLNMD